MNYCYESVIRTSILIFLVCITTADIPSGFQIYVESVHCVIRKRIKNFIDNTSCSYNGQYPLKIWFEKNVKVIVNNKKTSQSVIADHV